jgi:hypothetical protein
LEREYPSPWREIPHDGELPHRPAIELIFNHHKPAIALFPVKIAGPIRHEDLLPQAEDKSS